MDERAQTATEYLLLLAGVIAFVVILVLLWSTRILTPASNAITNHVNTYRNLTNVS